MSDIQQKPTVSSRESRREARAEAAAAKARAKGARPWWRKKRILIPSALVALIVVTAIGSGTEPAPNEVTAETQADTGATVDGEDEANAAAEDGDEQADSAEEPANASVGEAAADGAFTFTVDKLKCGQTQVGDEFFREKAQGQFCVLTTTVENTGNEAGTLFADDQYLLAAGGDRYSADGEATFALDPEGDSSLSEINPGNTVDGKVVFDVPAGADIVAAEMHDSAFSGGVEVDLK